MKSTWIVAAALTLVAAFAQAQQTPTLAPAPTPPVVGMNVDPPPGPPSGMNYPPATQPGMQPSQQQLPSLQQLQQMQQMQLPPGLVPTTMPTRPSGSFPRSANMPTGVPNGMPNGMPATALPPGMQAQENQQKSEIIAVLPPAQRPPEVRAVLRTSVGDITVRLDRLSAPLTVDYFTGIAKGETDFTDIKTSKPVKRPFYNGLIFHRVVKNTLIQTGDPFGNGRGNSGRTIPDELKPSMKFDRPGLVAMAPMRESKGTDVAKGTNSSQFFITLREMPEWNGQYTIFGEVEDGLDVVQKIANSKVGPTERPIKRIYLVAVDIVESAK